MVVDLIGRDCFIDFKETKSILFYLCQKKYIKSGDT